MVEDIDTDIDLNSNIKSVNGEEIDENGDESMTSREETYSLTYKWEMQYIEVKRITKEKFFNLVNKIELELQMEN